MIYIFLYCPCTVLRNNTAPPLQGNNDACFQHNSYMYIHFLCMEPKSWFETCLKSITYYCLGICHSSTKRDHQVFQHSLFSYCMKKSTFVKWIKSLMVTWFNIDVFVHCLVWVLFLCVCLLTVDYNFYVMSFVIIK